MSYTNLVYHIVFRTYHSEPSFAEEYRKIIVDGGVEIDEKYFLMD